MGLHNTTTVIGKQTCSLSCLSTCREAETIKGAQVEVANVMRTFLTCNWMKLSAITQVGIKQTLALKGGVYMCTREVLPCRWVATNRYLFSDVLISRYGNFVTGTKTNNYKTCG